MSDDRIWTLCAHGQDGSPVAIGPAPEPGAPVKVVAASRYDAAIRERDEARDEAKWRRQAMNDARDKLAGGDGQGAYDALTRHEHDTASTPEQGHDPAQIGGDDA